MTAAQRGVFTTTLARTGFPPYFLFFFFFNGFFFIPWVYLFIPNQPGAETAVEAGHA